MHVGSLHLFETPAGYKGDFYAAVRRMMERGMAPVLRRRLATLPLHLANPAGCRARSISMRTSAGSSCRSGQVGAARGGGRRSACRVARSLASPVDAVCAGRPGQRRQGLLFQNPPRHARRPGRGGAGTRLVRNLAPTHPAQAEGASGRRQICCYAPPPAPGTLALMAAAFRHDAAQYIKLVRELPGVVRTLADIVRSSAARRSAQREPERRTQRI